MYKLKTVNDFDFIIININVVLGCVPIVVGIWP